MREYDKINTFYLRDGSNRNRIIDGAWCTPELAYLHGLPWIWTEKLNGTNCRVQWTGDAVRFGGRTDDASMPIKLIDKLDELFRANGHERLRADPLLAGGGYTLYGEGIGAGIQHGSGKYGDLQFVLFDVLADATARDGSPTQLWLNRQNVVDVAEKLHITVAPEVRIGTLDQAAGYAQEGFKSAWGDFEAEGLVCHPLVEMQNRRGERCIAKIKTDDFR